MFEVFFLFLFIIHIIILIIKNYYSTNLMYDKLTYEKKNYFVKNLFKSYFLFFFSIIATYYGVLGYIYNQWHQNTIHALGLMYSAVDLYGLLTIKNMSITTTLHHCVVITLSICNLFVTYPNYSTHINLMIIYTLFSAYSFLVNHFLAVRLINKNLSSLHNNITLAYYSYLFNCMINWIIHTIFVLNDIYQHTFNIPLLIYCIIILAVINDDIVLISFLKYQYLKLKISYL